MQDEAFDAEYGSDFLERVAQKTFLPLGTLANSSLEEREKFTNNIPFKYIRSFNSSENYLLLTKFHWILGSSEPLKIDFSLEGLDNEILKAVEFCARIEISFQQPSWLLGKIFD